ncbi:aminodeoxychorismate synthase subunit I [Salsuginibacillus halophilus]|uniref:Aminodeoxychorismate synthase subunit I n=1 Tax=Salsuginibacillus halophilus TaxID=517424 RepID=A0A2P8H7T0_9BACI|nr:aminodeoxychorismate synthase, component I [Salsuginibacillus halophilus]PSL42276.1 aminodeoxychorismate synthase subunit I [Salsuginibacillus halophilus]
MSRQQTLASYPNIEGERRAYTASLDIEPGIWFEKYKEFSQGRRYHMVLESGRSGRYSMMGVDPFAVLKGKDDQLTVETAAGEEILYGELLDAMKTWMKPFQTKTCADLPDFQGGALGYLSYDYVRQVERLPQKAEDDLNTYDLYFLVFEDVFVYDHEQQILYLIAQETADERGEAAAATRLAAHKSAWMGEAAPGAWTKVKERVDTWEPSFSKAGFAEAVERVKHYISQGDVFQVNLSVRQSKPLNTPPLHIYEKLRMLNPSPYMGYMQTPEMQLVSASPELLVKKRGREASTRPIAGTRPRGDSSEADAAYVDEMLGNEKERAEHVMLVDLERNDLGRVCAYGSVEVDELMVVEKYSHVMHIVSNVKGLLRPDVDAYDMIKATFPGGTITGAPKVRTMEIIEELEPVRRGVYTGSMGWIGFNGDMELSISIRTMVAAEGQAYVQAGAGIVIDSKPEAEYEESLKKAIALWRAKEMSEEELTPKREEIEQ